MNAFNDPLNFSMRSSIDLVNSSADVSPLRIISAASETLPYQLLFCNTTSMNH